MKKYKILFTSIILFFINCLVKGLFIGKSPNSISLTEIDLLKNIGYFPAIENYSFRIISIFLSAAISVFTFLLIYKKTKNYVLGLVTGIVLIFTPWLYVISRYLNIYLFFILLLIVIFLISSNYKINFLILLLSIMGFIYILISKDFVLLIREFSTFLPSLFTVLDFRVLFFEGDPSSRMLHIPMTGFFMYCDLLAFFCGLYFIYLAKKVNKDIQTLIGYLFFLGVVFFSLLSKDLIFTLRGIILFYCISLIIGFGYYYFFNEIGKRLKFIRFIVPCIVIINVLFFSELLINHFDKKNSFEWGYAETQASKYIINNQNKTIYLTDESNKINRFLQFFTNKKATIITLKNAQSTCFEENISCIVREHELPYFGLEKNDIKIIFSNFDGLPVYFLIDK